jgi:hypothetical protein
MFGSVMVLKLVQPNADLVAEGRGLVSDSTTTLLRRSGYGSFGGQCTTYGKTL